MAGVEQEATMRGRYGLYLIGILCLLGMALLAGPGGGEAQVGKVRLATSLSPPSLDSIVAYVASDVGIFRKHGLEVEAVEYRGGATAMRALIAGEVDAGMMGITDAIVAASKGAKVRVYVVSQPVTPYHFVARKEAGTSFPALVGKNVGVAGIGATAYHMARIILARSGVDPERMKYVVVGSPADRFRALVAGKIDATVVTDTEMAKLAQYPEILSLARSATVVPEIPYISGMAKEEYIEKQPERVYRLTKAIIETNRWIAVNKAGTLEVLKKLRKEESPEVLSRAYDLTDPRLWGVNGDLTEAAYNFTADFLVKVGYMASALPYDRFFDRRFVERALGEMGRM